MSVPELWLAKRYEELANHFARQGESRQRDQCLVLAADSALSAGHAAEAERLRKRLLLTNPHHLVRPYHSMAEAMQSNDIREFVLDLRNQWPAETVAKLLNLPNHPPLPASYALDAPPAPKVETRRVAGATAPAPTPKVVPSKLATLFFLVGLALAGAIAFVALAWPALE